MNFTNYLRFNNSQIENGQKLRRAQGLINEKKLTKFILRRIKKVQSESKERAELTEKIFENKSKNQFDH